MKQRMLNWSKRFSILLFLDSNEYESAYGHYECLLAVDAYALIAGDDEVVLTRVYDWHRQYGDWLFGHISYDHKNQLERLSSRHGAKHLFAGVSFFCPKVVCYIDKGLRTLTIESIGVLPDVIFEELCNEPVGEADLLPVISFKQRINQDRYLAIIQQLRAHITDGDCYEINFCNEGFAAPVIVDPLAVFKQLNRISPAPFAAWYRTGDQFMMCASPERYLQKQGERLIAQPIKGTAKRDGDAAQDAIIREQLRNSIKDRAENVMIVDLMRNDLARSTEAGSVVVDELFGIYSFPQVHQMVSTISGKYCNDVPFTDILRYSFPMGSMTGAPKIKVMELIDRYEESRRSLFSGTVGYISPTGDFDFNVIIRSLFYNADSQYLSYQTGGAITYDSDPQLEWEEMRLKAWALERIFGGEV